MEHSLLVLVTALWVGVCWTSVLYTYTEFYCPSKKYIYFKSPYFFHWKIPLGVFCVSQNGINTPKKVISCCTYQNQI